MNCKINEVNASDLNLNSFKVRNELNQKLWVNGKLNSRVRLRLLDIVNDFIRELSINVEPEDIVFTGSLANYNWSKYSDIDIHLVYDFKKIYKDKEFVDDYFKTKRDLWNNSHEDLKIYGFPIEISVEDKDNDRVSTGVYSLNTNKWISEPDNFDDVSINEKYIKEYSAKVMTEIDDIEKVLKNEKDKHRIEKKSEKVKKLFDRLKKMRKESLSRSGEMSSGNIIWKLLRRTGYLDKMWDIIDNSYNKINTLK